jgi:phosphoglycolate phosphatase-like HAD superfamily hydrolase
MNDLVKGHIIFDHDGTLFKIGKAGVQLFPGMEKLLLDLKKQNFALYVWTARPRRSAIEFLNEFKIAALFTEIYCFDDGRPKPHPQGLETLTLGIEKNKIIHIGDSITDIEGAQAFGVDVIAACWNDLEQAEDFIHLTPFVARNLEECKKIIEGKYV